MTSELSTLVEMTRTLGDPSRDLVIIGEGNTSMRAPDDTFWIKASGQQMHNLDAKGFVQVRFAPILGLLDSPPETRAELDAILASATVSADAPQRPSIEVSFHAMLLAECGANCIAHTHPVVINQIMCSTRAEQFANNRQFPDEVVLCGPRSALVPYADPGLPLAIEMRNAVREFAAQQGETPRVILLKNHGLICLGSSTTDALNVTAMCVKAAEIFVGACSIGEPVFMSEYDVMHIYRRPDEIYRRARFT